MLRHLYSFIFLLSVLTASLQTSGEELVFSNLNTSDGLSHNSVISITQDSCGFLWFGTNDGLNLYDGYHFKIYRNINGNPNSLSSNQIRQIIAGSRNDQWILTEKGLDRLNTSTEKISHYPLNERILYIHHSPYNDLLALTSRHLYRYVAAQDSLIAVLTSSDHFTTFAEDHRGQLYLGTQKTEIQHYSPTFQAIGTLPPIPNLPGRGNISHLHLDTENRLWVVVTNQTIGRFDSLRQKFTPLPAPAYNSIDQTIRAILDFDTSHLLIGTFNGLFFIDKNTGNVLPTSPAIGQKGELSHFSIYSLYKDRQGTLWVGTNTGGINYYSIYHNRFGFILPAHFSGMIGMGSEDNRGKMWFATEGGGLLNYDPVTQVQHSYLLNPDVHQAFNNNIIKAIHISGDSILCSTHRGEVYLFSIRTKHYKLLCDFKYNNILSVYKDSYNNIWMGTNTTRGLVKFKDGQTTDRFLLQGKARHLNQVTTILETKSGKLLFGTENGLYSYDLQADTLAFLSPHDLNLPVSSRIEVTALHSDTRNNIWMATANNGLFILNQELHLLQALSHLAAPEEKILSLTESPAGQFWFTTNRKLYRYHPGQNICDSFDVLNGLPSQEFSTNSIFASQERQLYLPGNKGITIVNTCHFPTNPDKPAIRLTTLRVNNRQVNPQPQSALLTHPLGFTSEIILRHDETNIAIGYTALNYINPLSNRYAYRLNGIDHDWIQANGHREAIYNNLPPGNYTFQVKASNNDGIWNEDGPVLHIRVLAPLWQRWWAYLLYTLVLFVIIRQFFIYRQRKLALEHQLHFNRLQQEQSEKIHQERLRFFTQVAHEFRTPLTLIINPLDELSRKTIHISGAKEALVLIQKNTRRLLTLTNNLLNIQQLENGKSELHPSPFDFHEFMQELYYTFQSTAQNRDIRFTLEMENVSLPVSYDRDELEKAIFNLLSNAFKFTPSGGRVILSATLRSDSTQSPDRSTVLQIEVRDNGIGIRPEDKDKLFEPFTVSHKDLHGEITGSGIGLSVVHSIIEQHRGTITIGDASPQGTLVNIQLPYVPAVLPVTSLPGIVAEKETIPLPPPVSFSHRSISLLLVDDNPEIRTYLAGQLEKEYKIQTAENGQEALDIANHQAIDLIISDVIMPIMDGNELCRQIKSSPALCHIPVILLTAKAMTMHIEEGFNAGADDYLVKPFKLSALKARIQNILHERERLKEIYSKKLSLKSAGIEVESIDKTFMEKYVAIVRENISDPDFNVENLCRQLGMSRAAFYRKIKAITTLSPAETIRSIRIECAAELLKTTPLSAAEIAFQVGFGSYAHFSTYFKSIYGVSPKEYKENAGSKGTSADEQILS